MLILIDWNDWIIYKDVIFQKSGKSLEERRTALRIFTDVTEKCQEEALKWAHSIIWLILILWNHFNILIKQVL